MKIIVLAGGFDQMALINELHNRNAEVILIDYYDNPPAMNVADKHYTASTLDTEAVKKIAIEERADLITTGCTDQALLTVAKVSEELGLPCYMSYQTAKNVTNKSYMKTVFKKNKIATANYKIIDSLDLDDISSFKYPLVVKPVDCNSSKGVKKVFSFKELKNATVEALQLSRTNTAIIEEFKEGKEISVDVYVENGKAKVMLMTESSKIKNTDGFTITQSKFPVDLQPSIATKIENIAQGISNAFKIDNSPLLIQLITDGNEVNVLEFSARIGGGTKYKLIEILTGVNIMKVYVDRILGNTTEIDCSYGINYAHLNYCYCKTGTFNSLENFEKLKTNNIIEDYFQYKSKGMKIQKAETSGDRAAGYLVIGNTLEELKEKETIANEQLKIISEEGKDIFLHNIL